MNSYSIKQFSEEDKENIIEDENFAINAQKGNFAFFENISPKAYEKKIEKFGQITDIAYLCRTICEEVWPSVFTDRL